jgi:hypothetical protein
VNRARHHRPARAPSPLSRMPSRSGCLDADGEVVRPASRERRCRAPTP